MSRLRRQGLQLDDPLAPSQPAPPNTPPAQDATATPGAIQNGRTATEDRLSDPAPHADGGASPHASVEEHDQPTSGMAGPVDGGVWRAWSGIASVGSFRVPHELLVELGDTARELQLPIGMIVTAAITKLLDQPPDTIAALVDKAEDARIQGRRTARRRVTERTGQ